jgi:hypothetical protein
MSAPDDHAGLTDVPLDDTDQRQRRRQDAVAADEAFRQAVTKAVAAGQECAPTSPSTKLDTKNPIFVPTHD